ncbi:MAG: YaiI/YqxD family protein [Desulfobacteraceae bacterium]|nr:YaiI/YqxD family protein [Desulfobacteraceae bacterium]
MFAVSRCRPTREANLSSAIYGSLPRIKRCCLRGVASRACRKRTPGTWIIGYPERSWQNHEDEGEGFDLLHIFVDADACPVKLEIYRVAGRYGLEVTLVANSRMRVPDEPWITLQVVKEGFDAADDWIVENVHAHDIVVTTDIHLADRCIKKGSRVLGSNGKPFTEDNIGMAVASRDLMSELRSAGEITGGSPPLTKKDRSHFLQQLDNMIQSIRRQP